MLYDEAETTTLLDRFLDQLVEHCSDDSWCIVGIHRRGDVLARRLRDRLRERGRDLPLGVLDITLYRDDFRPDRPQPIVRPTEIGFEVDSARILLIDDVFQTGRTVRAALTQLADYGRPRQVVLAVFIDRQHRELPICPDRVGLTVDRPASDRVQLLLREIDGADRVQLAPPPEVEA